MGDYTESSTPQPAGYRQAASREDCWTDEATSTLVDAWGSRYLELNRGNLRQKDWQEVADVVNARHGHTKKTRRTDVQCKNRIDTLKKKYKTERGKIAESNGTLTSSWGFFPRLDVLIGPNFNKNQQRVATSASPLASQPAPLSLPSPPLAVPLPYRKAPSSAIFTPVILPQKRTLPSAEEAEESYFRRNYSAIAAAAAAAAEDEPDAEEGDSEGEGMEDKGAKEEEEVEVGRRRLAKAIERFGEIYERVEGMKQKQMVELEKQRMQFAKELEVQRMQLFMDTRVQLEKIKHAKRSGSSDDIYS